VISRPREGLETAPAANQLELRLPGLAAWVAACGFVGWGPGNFLASRDCNTHGYSARDFALSVTAITDLRDEPA
jgi:hypothetical protein